MTAMRKRMGLAGALAAAAMTALPGGEAFAGVLDDVRSSGAIRLAYREDAAPFSSRKNPAAAPEGYTVDLCRAVVTGIARQLGVAEIKVAYVPVTSADRFDAIAGGKADLLCEATTHTLKRRETLGFSIPTFVDGATFVIGADGPKDLKSLAGKKVGVLVNTTTEADLRRSLQSTQVSAEIVPFKVHREGLEAVAKGGVAAYYGDRSILTALMMGASPDARLMIADTYLSVEPYALAIKRGDEDFRLAVDRALSEIYRSGEIAKIFATTFGESMRPSPTLLGLYTTSALPQ
jgi:ABC-type amino acid transport substrate-binding protein